MRLWWNWQTRYFEVVVAKAVQVQDLQSAPFFSIRMKMLFPALAAVLLLAGCAHRYDVTLTNGVRLTNVSRPLLDRESGVYVYKDIAGHKRQVIASRVEEIEPHSSRKVTNQFGQ